MKTVRFHEFGGPEVLKYEDAPDPEAGPDQMLVRVHAAAVNPVDWKLREGWLRALDLPLPITNGGDISGVVVAVGSDVTEFRPGDAVFGGTGLRGGYAEFIALGAHEVAAKPATLDHVQAAAVPLAALTGWQALFDIGGLRAGQRVLIHAAAGGIGSLAVQFAKLHGAYVIGTASEANIDFVRDLGADEVIDYRRTPFETAVRDVDLVLDLIGGEVEDRSWSVLKPGGLLVGVVGVHPSADKAKAAGVRSDAIFMHPDGKQLSEIAGLIDAGKVRVTVSGTYPLSAAVEAQELVHLGHTRGKVVLTVAG